MPEGIIKRLFSRVHVSILYTLPVIVVVFALSGGFVAIVFIEEVMPKDPGAMMEVNRLALQNAIKIIKIISIILIIFAGIVGVLLSRSINQSISSIVKSYRNIKDGKPLEEVEARLSGDEMEELTANFNRVVEVLNSYILESLMGCTMILDNDLNVLSMNMAARNAMAVGEYENVHKKLGDVLGGQAENLTFLELLKSSIKEETVSSSEKISFRAKNGETVTVGLTASILRNEKNEPVGLFVIFKNLTKILEVQRQIRRTEKMVSLGRMSAGIAHEIRNPLGSIKGLTQLLMERSPDDEKVQRYTGVMIREIDRLNNVVQKLLNFSNPTEREFTKCDINEILKEVVELAGYERKEGRAHLKEEYDTSAPVILAEREKLVQALLNILMNALEITGPNDEITIKTYFGPEQFVFEDLEDRDGIAVEITNTGSTIEPEMMEKIFEPFFTTKEEGSGLGLAITQQVIASHNGNLKVASKNTSTTFRIELPIVIQHA
ncbi:MAG: ATP-binding protein [Nitrospinota bacterium]